MPQMPHQTAKDSRCDHIIDIIKLHSAVIPG
jgi:hypothetical protein